jgi:PIN domain nuclease of toxin-antitoxin system
LALRFLLDTHVVVRWLSEPKRLSQQQRRVIREATRRSEPVAFSAVTLLEIANLFSGAKRIKGTVGEFFGALKADPVFEALPITIEIAMEMTQLVGLPDPLDRAIVATARVHGLRLLTSDQRIIEANLVPVVE